MLKNKFRIILIFTCIVIVLLIVLSIFRTRINQTGFMGKKHDVFMSSFTDNKGNVFTVNQILVTMMDVFCYIIADDTTKDALVIDPAGDIPGILNVIEKNHYHVKWIINTHGHIDHVAGDAQLTKKTGAPVFLHVGDAGRISGLKNSFLALLLEGNPMPAAYQKIKDGDGMLLGNFLVTIMHTPGHSKGSVCVYIPGHLFTGDTIFTEEKGRSDFAGGSEKELLRSIRERILTLPDDTIVWPGHDYGKFPRSTVKEQKARYL